MAVDLSQTDIDPSRPEFRRMLENLQANILKPHGRKESNLLVLRFTGEPKDVRPWIRRFGREEVTSMRQQLDETRGFKEQGTPGQVVDPGPVRRRVRGPRRGHGALRGG